MLAAVPSPRSRGRRTGLPSPLPMAPVPSSKPTFVDRDKQEEKCFTGTCCLWSEQGSVRCSGTCCVGRGHWAATQCSHLCPCLVPALGWDSWKGPMDWSWARGFLVTDGSSGSSSVAGATCRQGWYSDKETLFQNPTFLANPHCLCLTHFAREQGHTRSTELNSQTSPRRALEKLVTALTIHSSLTDAWKLHTSPSYEENGFSSPVLLRRAGINATLTLRHLFCPCWLHLSTCSCCGCREPANRCSPSLQVPLPVGPHVPMMPQPCCAHSTSIPGKEQPWQRPPPPGMHPKGM